MPLKRPRMGASLPEVNLIPMMDVLMTVLTFFIIISMTLTGQAILGVHVPQIEAESGNGSGNGASDRLPSDPLILGVSSTGELLQNQEVKSLETITAEVVSYLATHPDGVVILKADQALVYAQVADILVALRDVGGDRIYLGVEK